MILKVQKVSIFIILFLAMVNQSRGDIITLKNGQVIEGVARDIGKEVEIRTRTTRLVVPKTSIQEIEEKEYDLPGEGNKELTPEKIKRQQAESLFRKAQGEIDRLNISRGISLLEQSVQVDKTFDKGLEQLIVLLADRQDFIKAKKYLDQLKELHPLTPDLHDLEGRIESGYGKQIAKGKRSEQELTGNQGRGSLPSWDQIPESPPAADYTGAYYLEYSFYARIQQSGNIASLAIYAASPDKPLIQCSARVKGNYIMPDLSRIYPSIPPKSIFCIMSTNRPSFSLYYSNTLLSNLGKKIMSQEELEGFKNLLTFDYSQALAWFEKAAQKDPQNPHVLFGLGRAQMLSGQPEKGRNTFEKIQNDPDFVSYFFMKKFLQISIQYARTKIMTQKGENALSDYKEAIRHYPFRVPDFGPFSGAFERSERLTSYTAEEGEKLLDPYKKTFQAIENTYKKEFCHWPIDGSITDTSLPDSNNFITLGKLLLIKAKLACYENRFEDALTEAIRIMRLGQHMNHGRLEIRKIGIQLQKYGIEAFRELIYTLEEGERADEVKEVLVELSKTQPAYDYQSLVSFERVEWPNRPKTLYTEAALMARVDLAGLSMLPIAVAAKKFFLTNNRQWPVSISMLVPDFLEEAPLDPFGGGPLKLALPASGFRIYSIGPDRTDDRGLIPYNPHHPTKGFHSEGDIIMDIR